MVTAVGSEDIFDVRFNGAQQSLAEDVEYRLGAGPDELLIQYSNSLAPSLGVTSKRGAVLNIYLYPDAGHVVAHRHAKPGTAPLPRCVFIKQFIY